MHPCQNFQNQVLSIVILALHVSYSQANDWDIKVHQDFIPIMAGDIMVPIVERSILVEHNAGHMVEISEDRFISSTFSAVQSTSQVINTSSSACVEARHARPTLIISIPGWEGSIGAGDETQDFQRDMDKQLKALVSHESECHWLQGSYTEYWMIKWDSGRNLSKQVRALARKVSSFLKDQPLDWDVMIVGFSRGGIFADALSAKLPGHKIDNLEVILLDPTAAIVWGDRFPLKRPHVGVDGHHKGESYYDGDELVPVDIHIGTASDRSIQGYTNALVNLPGDHSDYANSWVPHETIGFTSKINRIGRNKSPLSTNENVANDICRDKTGVHAADLCTRIISIGTSPTDIDINIVFEDGNVVFDGNISIADGLSLSSYASVGSDGLAASSTLFLISAAAILNNQGAEISADAPLAHYGASLNGKDGARVVLDTAAIGTEFKLGLDTEVNLTVFGKNIDILSIDTSSFAKAEDYVVGGLKSVGGAAKRAGNYISETVNKLKFW